MRFVNSVDMLPQVNFFIKRLGTCITLVRSRACTNIYMFYIHMSFQIRFSSTLVLAKITLEISLTIMNSSNMHLKLAKNTKTFTTRFTLVIFDLIMNYLDVCFQSS